jgi:hypothetical protein
MCIILVSVKGGHELRKSRCDSEIVKGKGIEKLPWISFDRERTEDRRAVRLRPQIHHLSLVPPSFGRRNNLTITGRS